MGKPSLKKKRGGGSGHKASEHGGKPSTLDRSGSKVLDGDETIFAEMAQELREEGNKLFQRREYERALLNYEKAAKLLPSAATSPAAAADVACLHSNLAACYMQMSPPDHYRAVNECNLALDAAPRYSKALLKRARCFEALGRFDLAVRDVDRVLAAEPGNLTAVDLGERVRRTMVEKGFVVDEKAVMQTPEEVVAAAPRREKPRNKKKGRKAAAKAAAAAVEEEGEEGKPAAAVGEPAREEAASEEEPPRQVKLVFGEDIRWAQVPASCGMAQLREAVRGKFPGLKAVLVKYKDREGDLVTITNQDELKWAEELVDLGSSLRLYITEASPEHEPYLEDASTMLLVNNTSDNGSIRSNNRQDEDRSTVTCIDDWIVQFARLFKNHVGVSSDEYLDLHEVSMKLYTEAIEDTITSDEAQEVFQLAEGNFQEMAALAFFQWGNVHMSRARKRLLLPEDSTKELVLEKVKEAYECAKEEYNKAGKTYEEAVRAKPDFFEGFLALAHQQFEQAKLSWYYAGSNADLDTWPSSEVLELFNRAEDNMEKGTEMWEEIEEQRLKNRSKPNQENAVLEKMGMEEYIKDVSTDDAAERASNMRSQINILWGMLLYERSVVEFKLGLPMWEDCLMAAIEKFKLGGASATNIAVLVKNHCANETAQDGLGFNVDEIVQAWNEMYDIKRWLSGVPSFRLEPLFRRRVPQLHTALEHI
ncbi:hypothetical protein ACQ4PT_061740 [Festuca glaucescens]